MLRPFYPDVRYAENASLSRDLLRSRLASSSRSYVGTPLRLVADGTDDIADDFARGGTRAEAAASAQRGMNLGDGLAAAGVDLEALLKLQTVHLLDLTFSRSDGGVAGAGSPFT